jgi:hypothetical protein
MALAQPALRLDSHTHPFTETCPTCDQPIPNDKAREIRARAAAAEERLAAKAEALAAQKFAVDKAKIEAATKALVEQAEREKAEAVNKANDDAAAKIEAATATGQKLAEAGFLPGGKRPKRPRPTQRRRRSMPRPPRNKGL